MRSWLLVPADKEKALGEAALSGADVVVLDLARAVSSPEAKLPIRLAARNWLLTHGERITSMRAASRWIRIGPMSSDYWRADLEAALEGAPDGVVLAECTNVEELKNLAAALYELEGRAGLRPNSTKIMPELGSSPASAFQLRQFAEELHPRVTGLSWDAAALARSLRARRMRGPGGLWTDPLAMVRAQVLLAAHAQGLQVIEAPFRDRRDEEAAVRAFHAARADGFTGMLAIHPSQIDGINNAFAPTSEELAEAREMTGLFELNPGSETVVFRGRMIGQRELAKATALLGED
ncbi:HpcH/HpaI aldolase/citrate lyase family protein [Qipengyuania vesicularis]|uniref:HpcH/HpaI aldolase/citrate lyase family protein n=1 Tax=Qipengyuania vesicularis TaxID=2867232 RepID=UPI001C884889|nr:aldolase/citrate lyase family protein [Qipengyuania vesicularis]MBX7527621.1 CoA ester lyase [Qipengyuania vesicularis]